MFAKLRRRHDDMRIVGAARVGHYLGDAGFFEVIHQRKGFGDGPPSGQQAVIAQDQRAVIADACDKALTLAKFKRHAFIVVIADPVIEPHRILVDRQQAAFERGDGEAGLGMGVEDTVDVMAGGMDRAVDCVPGGVDAMGVSSSTLPSRSILTRFEAVISLNIGP